MLDKILQLLRLSCPHKKMSHPFAAASTAVRVNSGSEWDAVPAAGAAANAGAHYIVCLDCGRKFNYDWQKMKIVR
jgi:predicted transcriptional regulator